MSDESVDAVVGTLVLCSVKDVGMTLQGNWVLRFFASSEIIQSKELISLSKLLIQWFWLFVN